MPLTGRTIWAHLEKEKVSRYEKDKKKEDRLNYERKYFLTGNLSLKIYF